MKRTEGEWEAEDPLEEVGRWPMAQRRRWAERTLEIKHLRGVTIEEAELLALAEEFERGARGAGTSRR